MSKRVVVNGACGRMGQTVVKTIVEDTDSRLVGACDKDNIGQDVFEVTGIQGSGVVIDGDLEGIIADNHPDVVIDFTTPAVVMDNIRTVLGAGIDIIVGTTGITDEDQEEIKTLVEKYDATALIVPNFALGAVLLMEFARKAAVYFEDVEIIELHHDQKLDAPSGTALKTAELIGEKLKQDQDKQSPKTIEEIKGVRGGTRSGIPIHSIRLPGLVAHQEVIFGGEGQSLTLRHDSYNRSSFMPGIRLALDQIDNLSGLVYGLENLL